LKLVGYSLVGVGVVITLISIFTTNSRYLDRSIYPLFAKALSPLNPTLDELKLAVDKYKKLRMIVGRKIAPQKIIDVIQQESD